MSSLIIYKASAGSGKTFTLTLEFLKIVIRYPNYYKNILAVTFTNKAAAEMKHRIVDSLYKLSHKIDSPFKERLLLELSITENNLEENSKIVLNNILHDYSRFSVMTIDSFFQKVISNFIKELGLQASYKLELNADKIIDSSINRLFKNLHTNSEVKDWLIEFIDSRISDEKSWNIKSEIVKLSYQLLNENLKINEDILLNELSDKNFLKQYLSANNNIISNFETIIKDLANKSIKIISDNNLAFDDFPGKSRGFINYFNKIKEREYSPSATVIKAIDNPDAWHKANDPNKEKLLNAFHSGLNDNLKKIIDYINSNFDTYNSASIINNNLFALGILNEINIIIKTICKENNIFLISDSALLLSKIIGENDSPFVYEKIGNIYKNIMIDEFQDTSNLQWKNLYPLVNNSLSENRNSLIVGDVKQSIYRWRNSDWSLLSGKINNEFSKNQLIEKDLNFNRRSSENVIIFNNNLLKLLVNNISNDLINSLNNNELSSKITDVYKDYEQIIPESKRIGGIVKAEIIDKNNDILESLKLDIADLLNNGIKQKDIAILVRTKKEGADIVNYFSKNEIVINGENSNLNIVSDEALLISSSYSVCLLIDCLKYLINRNELIYKFSIISNYARVVSEPISSLILNDLKNDDLFFSLLPNEFLENFEYLSSLPMDELIENLIIIFELNKNLNQLPYILSFQNEVKSFINENSQNIYEFINWWDEIGINKSIQFNSDSDAVRVLTIHKSKGLEFKAVLIPYCDWDLDANYRIENLIWLKPSKEPFNNLKLLPIRYSTNLTESIFKKDYYEEKFKFYIDNLNLLYVAITRAIDILYIYSKNAEGKGSSISNYILLSLNEILENKSINVIKSIKQNNNISYIFGKEFLNDNKSQSNSNFELVFNYEIIKIKDSLRVKSNEIFKKEGFVQNGNFLHILFSKVKTNNDLQNELNIAFENCLISEKEKENIFISFNEQLKQYSVLETCFNSDNKIYNEKNIIVQQNKYKRPDRVVISKDKVYCIDYKFGFEENEFNKKQVSYYISILEKMGYKNVEGYIWYFNLYKFIKV